MKLALALIICSAVQANCMPPMHTGLKFVCYETIIEEDT